MNTQTEVEVLQQLLPELEAQGYEVYLHPDRRLLPPFLEGYIPDAVALRADKNLAIEVTGQSEAASKKLEKVTARFENQPRWELRILWLQPIGSQRDLEIQPLAAIEKKISDVQELLNKDSLEGSLLLGWATFEALGRVLLPAEFQRPQTPHRLVEILAREGYITPSEADILRILAGKRNSLIHGELQVQTSKSEMQSFIKILADLRAQSLS